MKIEELGNQIRRARTAHGLTQQQLAVRAGVSRTTLNLLENGVLPDIGLKKASAILANLGLGLKLAREMQPYKANFLKIASTAASTRSKQTVSEAQLRRIFVTGKIPKELRPLVHDLLEEASSEVIQGLMRDLRAIQPAGKIEKNLERIAAELKISPLRAREWMIA